MSVSPELLHLRDTNEMEAEAAMRKVKGIISSAEFHGREHATQTMMKVFKIVRGYFEDVMTETQKVCDEAMDDNLAELNSLHQQQQQLTQLPIAASPAIEHAAATAAATAAADDRWF